MQYFFPSYETMICKSIFISLVLLYVVCRVSGVSPEYLQLNNLRYNECGRYTCPETGKFQFSPDIMYEYLYTLSINSTFDKKAVENSQVKLEFKVEIRIESCEGVLRVSRIKDKEGFAVFDVDGYDKIYEDVNRYLVRFSFYDGSILNVCPHEEESISSLNIKKGILSAFQNRMKRFDIDKFTSERDINGYCPTNYNLQRINGTTLVIRKIKDTANCLERCQLHSIIPTSKYIFQSRFHKWTPLNSTVVCHQTIDHSIPVYVQCHEEHMLKILPNQTYSSRTLISQQFRLIAETPSYSNIFTFLHYPEVTIREDLSFNHRKPKKSEITELEDSEALLLQLCNITSEEFQLDVADVFAKFIHTARHLSYDALETLLDKGSQICTTGRKHVQDSLPFLRSTAALSLMKDLINSGDIPQSTANGWLFAMSLFTRPDQEVISSVTPMLYEDNASNNVLLSVSSIMHAYNVWASNTEDKEAVLMAITYLETTLNETLIRREDLDKIVVLLKSIGNAGIQTETIAYTLTACIRNAAVSTEVKIAAIEAHRRLRCDFNVETLLDVYTNTQYEAEVRIAAYLQVMKCPTYGTIKQVKQMLQTETLNQGESNRLLVGSFVWSHMQNIMKSSLEYRVHLQSLLQDYNLQQKFKTDFRKYSRNYETSFFLTDYGVGGVILGNVIFSTKTYIPKYLTLNLTLHVFGEIINVMEVNVFVEGFERYVEKVFRGGTDYLTNKLEKIISPYRFLRSIPMPISEKIKYLWNNLFANFADPILTVGVRLFGNEIVYTSCRGQQGLADLIDRFDINNIVKDFLNGQQIKYDYSTVFMDMSYVSPTGAGVPLNLDIVGISITNFDTSVFMNFSDFSANDSILIHGKLKPRFSLNFEGSMGTDLVYEQTQVQVRNKIYTSSEMEGRFSMETIDNMSLSFNLPPNKFDILSFQSDLYYKNNTKKEDMMIQETSVISNQPSCFWPFLEQTLGLKVCSTYYTSDPHIMLQSLMHILKGPFKFSLYVEKSDPTAKVYIFKYNKKATKANESTIIIEFETPGSLIPRSMKTLIYTSPEDNNLTIMVHTNRTTLQAHGYYKYTPADKVLNFNIDIDDLRHIDLILELHMRQDKRILHYSPKLYLAISSKPVVELSGAYRWVEKKGIAQCDVELQFKTNKFDSNITGYIMLSDGSVTSNMHIHYKFEKVKNESFNFEFKFKDQSTKLKTVLLGNVQVESTSYPEINLGLSGKYQKSYDHIDARFDYVASPFEEDERKKLTIQGAFSYLKSYNGLKLNTFIEIKKPITDVNIKASFSHQNNPTTSNTMALVRYAKDRDIIVKLEIYSPQSALFHYEAKLNTTLPTVQQPMIVHVRVSEKLENEYDVDFMGTWFSGHTAMAKGLLQDKSTHYAHNYIIKLQVRSRLFNEVSLSIKLTFNELEHKAVTAADHNGLRYALMLRHLSSTDDVHETYIEYIYNNSVTYYLNNHLDIKKKEFILELHLDRYRDVHLAARGRLKRWDSNVGVELEWDVNRDPSQKIVLNFNTKSMEQVQGHQYMAKLIFEYPGHISEASFYFQQRGNYKSLSLALEMNPTSIIELLAYSENEFFTHGFAHVGFKLLTPFENWKETAFFYGFYYRQQSFQTNGNLTWQGNQNIVFDTQGGYAFEENATSLTLSSFLNSTLQDLSALAFHINYTSVENQVYLTLLLQPNVKYSLFVSTFGMIKQDHRQTEYVFQLHTKTPFLEYSDNELAGKLKLVTENRIVGNLHLRLNSNMYTLATKGTLNIFERSRLCLHITTPFTKFDDVAGLLYYDFDEKHIFLNLTGAQFHAKVNLVYLYNNVSNFHLRLEVLTPLSYLSELALIALYNGKQLEIRTGWNVFTLGFAGLQHFTSWSDLEYRVHLYTPIETFKESDAVFKLSLKPDVKIIMARVTMSNVTKVGVNIAYNSEKGKIVYQDECDNIYEPDTPGVAKKTILTNGLFELDTLIYPTIMGMFVIDQIGHRYTTDAKLAVFFLKMNVWDQIDYESVGSFNNTFTLTSSIDIFSSILSHITVQKLTETETHLTTDLEIVKFNQKLKGAVDILYEYKTIDAKLKQIKNKVDGIHNIAIKLSTPFEHLEHGEITLVTQIENYVFETVMKMVTKYTNISLVGDLQFLENYFDLNVAFDMSSVYVTVPAFRLQILRDFSKLEKRIAFILKEPSNNNDKFHDFLCIRSAWYMHNRDYISLSGEIKTPLTILDELKASLLYSHEIATETYVLEAYMKYSNKTEMKVRANLKPPNVTLNLESSMEGLRNAHFIGTLEKTGPGQQKIDAVMITQNNFRIQGWSSVTNLVPFAIKGKLLRGKDGVEISSVEMAVKKQTKGYNIVASLYSKGKSLSVETEITDYPDDVRIINLMIKTGRGELEYLHVNAELKLQHPGIYLLTIKGDTTMNDNKGSSISKIEIWFRNGIGALFASLDSATVKGKAEIFTVWKPPHFIYGGSKIHFLMEKKLAEVFNSKVYFLKEDKSFNNFSTGLIINLNKKWMMETNLTVMVNSSNDAQMATHLLLPNTNAYSMMASVKYDVNYHTIQHVIIISRPQDTPCYTISDVDLVGQDVSGIFAFRCGIKDTLYMMDNFQGKRIAGTNDLVLRNWLKSNTLTNALVTNVNYEKDNRYHVINLKFFYPPKKQIATTSVRFESTSNFNSFLNTTTPYPKIPYFACEVTCKSNETFYQRCGKVYLHDQPAFVNITHVKTRDTKDILNDGEITLKFPVTTWHEGTLLYTYLNTSVHINGSMKLFYNNDRIINGTFTKNSTTVAKYDRGFTHLKIGNMLMPVGVNYIHETDTQQSDYFSHDFKRVEVYKLKNASAFNITGEALLDTLGHQEWTTLKLFNFNRSIVLKSHTAGANIFQTGVFITLKREFWFNYDLKTNKTLTNTTYKKIYDLNLAYPRRNFSLVSDLGYGENYMASQFVLHNFITNPTKILGFDLRYTKPTNNLREVTGLIFHPSFEKNVTIFVSLFSLKTILADIKMNVEYSEDQRRKFEWSGVVTDKSIKGNRHYSFCLNGSHPATRFKLGVEGAFKSQTGDHYIGNNVSYRRSYLPEQFWNGRAILNTKDNIIEVQRVSTRALIYLHGDYKVSSFKHVVNTEIIKGTDTHISGTFQLDLKEKETYSMVNLTEDASDRLQIEGNIPENREAKFNVWRTYNNFNFPQFSFYVTLNHSRFLSSAMLWRTDVGTNILKTVRSTISYLWTSAQESVEFWTQFLRSEATETVTAVWNDAKPEMDEFLDDLHNIKSIQDNINYFKKIFNDSYNANEFFLKDIHELYHLLTHDISFLDTIESFPKLLSEIVKSMGETSQVIRKSLIWMVNTIRELYEQLLHILDQLVDGKAEVYISKFVKKGTEKFDTFVKDLHISFVSTMETALNEIVSVLTHYQKKIMAIFEPTFIEIVHHIDSTFWASSRKLMDFIYARKNELLNSPFFLRSANFTLRMDSIYKDLVKNDFMANVKKYAGVFFDVLYEYYVSQIPYREEIVSIGTEIVNEIKELYKLPLIAYTVDNLELMYNQIVWLYEYFDVSTKLQRLIPFFYRQLQGNSYTALEMQMKNQKPKTKFFFMPENGIIRLEQKLPFPWHAFNETPLYEELEEYKLLKKIQSFLSTSKFQFWSLYKSALTLLDPQSWFPPFKGHAQLIGFNNYITFDSKHIPFYGNSCQYLLSHDFIDGEFSLVLNSDEMDSGNQQSISLLFGQETITIQFDPVRVTVDSQKISKFPLQLNNTYVYFDYDMITVEGEAGITLKCNMYYHTCTIHLSGWFFGKVSGLLGTMNNEPSDDVFRTKVKNENYLWSLSPERSTCPIASNVSMVPPDYGVNEKCSKLFVNSSSPFEPCFNEVNAAPYYEICIIDLRDESVCSVAMAYVQSCLLNSVPLRIPAFCVRCVLPDNRYANEGSFVSMNGKQVPQSSDVVFIVEAKPCNQDLVPKKSIHLLLSAISKELIAAGITRNRYSLVVFGGEGIYNKPHSVIVNSTAFSTNATQFVKYFENLPTGNGSSDVFGALRFASKISLRVGISKTFILLLCSNCDPTTMDLDYSVLHHAMIEKSITLHTLMDDNFPADKLKTGKILFGLDSYTAYTKIDSKTDPKGDRDLHRQIKLTKSLLGYCTPLALESNGTLFTAKPLGDTRLSKKFVSVFAKRVAVTAKPDACQMCECHSDNNGVPFIECTSCSYPTPINFDFSLDDENEFSPTVMNFDSLN